MRTMPKYITTGAGLRAYWEARQLHEEHWRLREAGVIDAATLYALADVSPATVEPDEVVRRVVVCAGCRGSVSEEETECPWCHSYLARMT